MCSTLRCYRQSKKKYNKKWNRPCHLSREDKFGAFETSIKYKNCAPIIKSNVLITKDFRWCSIDRFQYYNIFYAFFQHGSFQWTLLYERFFFSLFWVFISVSITSVSCFYFLLPYLKKTLTWMLCSIAPRTHIHVQTKYRIYYLISLSFAVTQFSLHILVAINEMQSKRQW